MRVYAGIDALSGKKLLLTETIPAGPKAMKEAEKVRTRLINEVDEQRNPRTKATVNQLMDRYLELLDVEETTLQRYEQTIRTHIRPLIGHLPVGKLNGETLDALLAVLRHCRPTARSAVHRARAPGRPGVHREMRPPRLPAARQLNGPQGPLLR